MIKPIILCVDDEKSILDSLEEQLYSEFGAEFAIELAESAEEGLEIIGAQLPGQPEIPVILADYLMPGMKGDRFLIRVHDVMPETRKIMLTGQADLEAVTQAINHANLYRYIAKPWEKSDLLLTIREALASFRQYKTIQAQNADLQALNVRLQGLNQELEGQVAARTRDLQTQEALFRQIFDDFPDGMAIFDDTAKIIGVNQAFTSVFQYQSAEIRNCSLTDIAAPADAREEAAGLWAAVTAGETASRETKRCRKDGNSIWVSLLAYPLELGEGRRGGIAIYKDLTAQRGAEELLQRSYCRSRRSEFFNGLAASNKGIRDEHYAQAQLLRLDLKDSFVQLFLALAEWEDSAVLAGGDRETGGRILLDEIIDRLSERPEIYAWGSRGGIGVLFRLPDNEGGGAKKEKQIATELLQIIGRDFPGTAVNVGIAEFRPEMADFAERHKQAYITALIGPKIHPDRQVHHYWDIGAMPLLAKLADEAESERMLDRTIRKIREYDLANGTALFTTLEKMVVHDNLRDVAKEMFLHYKTVLFRKRSIERILEISLDSFEGHALISTALAIYYFREIQDKYKFGI